jgi:hypothetical protein
MAYFQEANAVYREFILNFAVLNLGLIHFDAPVQS